MTYAGPDRALVPLRPLAAKRAFANLIDNAVKHGGGARVTLSDVLGDAKVWIEDAAPGIPEAEFEAVFEPFPPSRSVAGPTARGWDALSHPR